MDDTWSDAGPVPDVGCRGENPTSTRSPTCCLRPGSLLRTHISCVNPTTPPVPVCSLDRRRILCPGRPSWEFDPKIRPVVVHVPGTPPGPTRVSPDRCSRPSSTPLDPGSTTFMTPCCTSQVTDRPTHPTPAAPTSTRDTSPPLLLPTRPTSVPDRPKPRRPSRLATPSLSHSHSVHRLLYHRRPKPGSGSSP